MCVHQMGSANQRLTLISQVGTR